MANTNLDKRRWIYLIAGTIGMLFAGIIYAWSILKGPLNTELGWQPTALSWNFTITMGMFCIGGIVGSLLSKKIGVKLSVVIGGILCGVGFVLSSFLSSSQLVIFYLTYGVMAGFGIGIAYNVLVSTVNAWFPGRQGFSSGCLMLGFGFSTLLLGTVSNSLFSSIGWRTTYIVLGIAIGVVLVLAGLIVKKPDSPREMTAQSDKEGPKTEDDHSYTPKQMLQSALFWKFFIFLVLLTSVGNSIAGFAKDLALFSGAGDSMAATLVGAFAVCNGGFRVVIGILFDKLGRGKAMYLFSTLGILTSVLCILTALTGSLTICTITLCIAGCTVGCSPTMSTAGANAFFGKRYYPTNFSIIVSHLLVASFMATLSSALVVKTGGYLVPFIIFLVISVIALILNLNINRKK